MLEHVLFVDDEENILAAFRRHLRKEFNVVTAQSGAEALDRMTADGPFAVVVADFRMPGMNGIQFLDKAKEIAPETVRIMLTGHADMDTAIEAVNSGNIFRFLTKPCQSETLIRAIHSGIKQYRLITAERDLFEKTLKTTVNLLIDVLSLANPSAFNRTLRIRRIARQVSMRLRFPEAWQVEMAATLSQIGCIALPPELLEKVSRGETLVPVERKLYSQHPAIGYRLLRDLHRLEPIAQMVRDQCKRYEAYELHMLSSQERNIMMGAQILHVAGDYDELIQNGMPHLEAVEMLRSRAGEYDEQILEVLREEKINFENRIVKLVEARSLGAGMILNQDLYSEKGELLAAKSQEITQTLYERIQVACHDDEVIEPVQVFVSVG